jgi:hypothetical protein
VIIGDIGGNSYYFAIDLDFDTDAFLQGYIRHAFKVRGFDQCGCRHPSLLIGTTFVPSGVDNSSNFAA